MTIFIKKTFLVGLLTTILACLAVFFIGKSNFCSGIVIGSAWMAVNVYFLARLMDIGMHGQKKHQDKIIVLSVLKFPVLYLIGFFILKSRYFSVVGIVMGLSVFLLALLLVWSRLNLASAKRINGFIL